MTLRSLPARLAALGVAGAILTTASGCLIMGKSSVEEFGAPVSSSALAEVTPGETSSDWLVQRLGAPTAKWTEPDRPGVEIWKYEHVTVRKSSGALLFVFASSSRTRTTHSTLFEVENGVVSRYWLEKD